MKNLFTLLLTLAIAYGMTVQNAGAQTYYFQDGGSNLYQTFSGLIAGIAEDGTGTQLAIYTLVDNAGITRNMLLDIHGYNFTVSGDNAATIADNKWFALKNTTGSGVFSGKIGFGGNGSVLKVHSSEVLGTGFSIASGALGIIEIGDGASEVTQTLSVIQTSAKVTKIVVKTGATLIIIPG